MKDDQESLCNTVKLYVNKWLREGLFSSLIANDFFFWKHYGGDDLKERDSVR